MPYQYLTFSDLYEEEVRSSAPSSPVMAATALSPVFLLPTISPSHAHAASSSSSSYRHHHHHHHHSSHHAHPHSHRKGDVHHHAMLKTLTQDSDEVASPTHTPSSPSSSCSASSTSSCSSTSSMHLDFLRVFKRNSHGASPKNSKHSTDSAVSTPASSRRSSFTSHGLASLHRVSATSSANTSPAISRQVTKVSDYDALIQRTAREEEAEEARRQRELQAYFNQAAHSGLALRRFS